MRRFSSYGQLNPNSHYYVPRKELIQYAYTRLVGDDPKEEGNYVTVWAPRQTGKSWLMQQIILKLQEEKQFDVVAISLENLKDLENVSEIIKIIARKIGERLGKDFSTVDDKDKFQEIFRRDRIDKPLILILDEFDSLNAEAIGAVAGAFRNIYTERQYEIAKSSAERTYLLHGAALIGVRGVLGIENEKGSPFNIQHSLNVRDLTFDEVKGLFKWYQEDSGQSIRLEVIDALYRELRGQPGLTCWFGELLTETFNKDKSAPITIDYFHDVFTEAVYVLPSTNILNIISKAEKEPYKNLVLELFKTDRKIEFRFDDKELNYLYMNGIIDVERTKNQAGRLEVWCRFASPFVQGRLFNYFSRELFHDLGVLIHPLDEMDDAVTADSLDVVNIIKRYKTYLQKNKEMVFRDMPRRKTDKRLYEAVYHFNFYRYLYDLLTKRGVAVVPQFPTGNGQIDLILKYNDRVYAIELKSFKDMYEYRRGIRQAELYGKQLGLKEIVLLFFVELKEEELKDLGQKVSKSGIDIDIIPIAVV